MYGHGDVRVSSGLTVRGYHGLLSGLHEFSTVSCPSLDMTSLLVHAIQSLATTCGHAAKDFLGSADYYYSSTCHLSDLRTDVSRQQS